MSFRWSFFLPFLAAMAFVARPAQGATRSWSYLTTGNGHNFSVYDSGQKKITTFLEHPYRYLRADPNNAKADGIGRRNLAFDLSFGVGSNWLKDAAPAAEPEYLDQTNIIHASMSGGDTYYFAPFGYEGNALVALLHASAGSQAYVYFNFHMGSNAGVDGESVSWVEAAQAFVETGPGGGAVVYVPLNGLDHSDCDGAYGKIGGTLGDNHSCGGSDLAPGFQKALGGDGWWAVAMQYVDDASSAAAVAASLKAWANDRAPSQILADAQGEWETWRKPPPAQLNLSTDELNVWRQSEAVLRMGQVREPNISGRVNHGMVLASLPPGEWHTGWVRDGVYGIVALTRMGHFDEAKLGLEFFLNAGPVGKFKSYVSNQDYRISVVRYYGSGEEQADYSGQPTPNVETDGWGLVLWAARQYVDASGDIAWLAATTTHGDTVYDALKNGVAAPLEANLESNGVVKADSSIWEVHDANKRHFAYTSLAAARGFCDMARLAKNLELADDVSKYQGLSAQVKTGIFSAFLDKTGAIAGSLEGLQIDQYIDASVVEAINWSLVPDSHTTTATLTLLNNLVVASGGYKRTSYGSDPYDMNEWGLLDLRMSTALRGAGRAAEAGALLALVVDKARANFDLIPELYCAVPSSCGSLGVYTGSIPMVGYGAGAFVMTLLDRGGIVEPTDCGTAAPTNPDGGGGGGSSDTDGGVESDGGSSDGIPYVAACVCSAGGGWALASGTATVLALTCLALACALLRRRFRSFWSGRSGR